MGGREAGGTGNRGDAATVCNASPLIALAAIGRLDLHRDVFSTVAVPPAVIRETPRIAKPSWIVTRRLAHPIPPPVASARLGPGETEAIALALELGAGQILLDDRDARRLAAALGLRVAGTLGVLLLAKQRDVLPAVQPVIEALLSTDFHLAPWLVDDALRTAGEPGHRFEGKQG